MNFQNSLVVVIYIKEQSVVILKDRRWIQYTVNLVLNIVVACTVSLLKVKLYTVQTAIVKRQRACVTTVRGGID